ncbi:MAG: SDR family oxidoreductase [Corynebacterium sp.]|nr:SDR family oxidoreductase [Corynebacterium sp.]
MPKTIVITGASSGFGELTARLLAEQGHNIVAGARRKDRLQQLIANIKAEKGNATYAITDVTDIEQVQALAQLALDTFGRIDVWINNAGVMQPGMFEEANFEQWDATIDLNIKGVLYGIGAALPHMKQQKSGHIINIASVAGHMSHAGTGVYHATKWAVRAISESLREEVAMMEGNIRVTVISPGAFHTELTNHVNNPLFRAGLDEFYETFAAPADRVAHAIAQAIDVSDDCCWNEIILRPIRQIV